ncbi:MAG: hypothetical protein ACOX8W_10775 [bacterium]
MLNSPIIAFFVQGIPETIALIIAGLTINQVKFDLKYLYPVVTIYTVSAFFVKQLPFKYGIHTIILIFILAVYLNYWVIKNLLRSLVTSISAFALQALIETMFLWFLVDILNLDLSVIFGNQLNRLLTGLSIPILMLIAIGLIKLIQHRLPTSKIEL